MIKEKRRRAFLRLDISAGLLLSEEKSETMIDGLNDRRERKKSIFNEAEIEKPEKHAVTAKPSNMLGRMRKS